MNTKADNKPPESLPLSDGDGNGGLLKCDDFQMLLFAYMSRELGDVQSRVVREHLRTCDACRREAADIEATLEALQAGAPGDNAGANERLSDERRKRILRAVFHPVIDWIDRHHRLVSTTVAVLLLITVVLLLRDFAIFKRQQLEKGIPIWRMFKSGRLPELVEEARRNDAQEQALAPEPEIRDPEKGTSTRE